MVRLASRTPRAFVVAALLVIASACTERRTAERADSDLSRDLALAGRIDAQPALRDSAVAPAAAPEAPPPAAPAPRDGQRPSTTQPVVQTPALTHPGPVAQTPTPATRPTVDSVAVTADATLPAPVPVKLIPAGTGLALSSGMKVCTNTNKVGDRLVATVTSPVDGDAGAVIPAGSRVVLEVARLVPGDAPDDNRIDFRPTVLYVGGESYAVSGAITSSTPTQRAESPSTGVSDKTKVAGGAIAGAILGQILGHDTKATIIGAAAGAATGAAVARAQKSYQACLPEGASLVLTLASPLTLR